MKSNEDLDFQNEDQYISQFMSLDQHIASVDFDDSNFLNNQMSQKSQILLPSQKGGTLTEEYNTTLKSEVDGQTRRKSGGSATAKYREKKKKYVQELQESVRNLDAQIKETDDQIQKKKDEILKKLESLAKLKLHNSDNSEIFSELQLIVSQAGDEDIAVDLDKINLLIDTLKYRIGPTGRQRQAKIDYQFKNIVNTLMPGLHRYLMKSAASKLDMFGTSPEKTMKWTQPLFKQINITEDQKNEIRKLQPKLNEAYQHSKKDIQILYNIRKQLKNKEIDVENVQEELRQHMNALQSAKWIIVCEKYKYKRECFFQFDRDHEKFVEDYLFTLEQKQLGACRKLVKRER